MRENKIITGFMITVMALAFMLAACDPMEGGFEKIKEKAGGGADNLPPSVAIVPNSDIDGPWIRSTLRAKVTGNLAGSDTVYEWKRGSATLQTGGSSTYTVENYFGGQDITVTASRPSLSAEPMTSAVYSIPDVVGIYDAIQLQDMAVGRNNILARSISITSATWKPIGYITAYVGTPFTGTLDGNGKSIDFEEINISGSDVKFGLFYEIGSGANIKNLQLYGVLNITYANYDNYMGLLAAYQTGGIVQNVSARVIINAECDEDLGESGSCEIGGLIGRMEGGTIRNCYTKGNITQWGDSNAGFEGGIVGSIGSILDRVMTAAIQNCWSAIDIEIYGGVVGGIVGIVSQASTKQAYSIRNCVAMMTELINGEYGSPIGAIVGNNIGVNTLNNNYRMEGMNCRGAYTYDPNDKQGGSIPRTTLEANDYNFWTGTLGWLTYWGGTGEDKPWKWWNGGASGKRMPILWFENTAIGM